MPLDRNTLRSLLTYIDPRPKDNWVKVAFALQSEYGDSGFDDWAEWSDLETNDLGNQAEVIWRSAQLPKNITISYVINEARDAGWSGEVPRCEVSADDLQQRAQLRHRRQQARDSLHAKALEEMENLVYRWQGAHPWGINLMPSPYLASKGIKARVDTLPSVHGRISLFPFVDFKERDLRGLQLISPTGPSGRLSGGGSWDVSCNTSQSQWVKRFYRGSRVAGSVHALGYRPDQKEITIVCEGVATAYAVGQRLLIDERRFPVKLEIVAASSAWNLMNIGNASPSALLVVDNDAKPYEPGTTMGVGEWYASKTHNRRWMPPDPDTDYADYVQLPDHPVHQELRSWILDNV